MWAQVKITILHMKKNNDYNILFILLLKDVILSYQLYHPQEHAYVSFPLKIGNDSTFWELHPLLTKEKSLLLIGIKKTSFYFYNFGTIYFCNLKNSIIF